jgi:DNA primase
MARIPDEEIERLKREVSVERLVSGFGVELKRYGANLIGRCPFHDDRTPSLVVTPETNLWSCKGACNIGGSVIDWIMKTRGVSFRYAVELLKADHPYFSRWKRSHRWERHHNEAASAGDGGRRRSGSDAPGG